MTFAEKARKEYPELCNRELGYPTNDCPHHFGFEREPAPGVCSKLSCQQCWNREIPEEPVEEAKPKTTKKTKAELLAEINDLKEELERVEKENARLERYSQYEESANEVYAMQKAFENAGFTREEAFRLVIDLVHTTYRNLHSR